MGLDARKTALGQIPVVDISALRADPNGNTGLPANHGQPTQQMLDVAQALHRASTTLGFIYVTGHGIPEAVLQHAREQGLDFFRSGQTQKNTVGISSKHRGWLKQGAAKMHDDALPDLKESFIWGYEDDSGNTPEDHPLRGQNQWPDFLPELRGAALDYFTCAHEVAASLLHGFALGLSLPVDTFMKSCESPMSRASFVYYPPQETSGNELQFGVGAHTDFGVLTVLSQDDVGGLQVQDINGDWIEAPPVPGSLVVNVGDLLSRWTAGAYKSTPHRVINSSGRERLSLVLAFDPDPDTTIDPTTIYTGELPEGAEEAISCGDYLVWRFGKAFSYRTESQPGT